MAIHLIVYGHGAGDPGAGGNGTNERDFNRKILHPFIKKWADRSKHTFVFYDISGNKDLYQETARGWGLYSMTSKQYDSITEIHEDAARVTATGGHVIISSNYNADKYDLALAQIINKVVGWWGSVKNRRGINGRNNLLNCNVAARRGINYRLMELGFITNKSDMSKIRNNLDAYAKGIVEGITGETLGEGVKVVNSPKETAKPTAPSKPNPTTTKYKEESFSVRQITDTALNVRKEPNTKSDVIKTLAKGKEFTPSKIVKNGEKVGQYSTWCDVAGGWVSMAYTTPVKVAAKQKPKLKGEDLPSKGYYTCPASMNIRSGAGTNHSIIGSYHKGQGFNYDRKVIAGGRVWLSYVSYSGQRRYVAVV